MLDKVLKLGISTASMCARLGDLSGGVKGVYGQIKDVMLSDTVRCLP